MKLLTNKFKSGELHEKLVVATWNLGNTVKPRKTCVEVTGRRSFRILTSSQQSDIQSKNSNNKPT